MKKKFLLFPTLAAMMFCALLSLNACGAGNGNEINPEQGDRKMSFLRCNPAVYVIDSDYMIGVCTTENGIISVRVGGETYYPDNNGCLPSEKNHALVRLPQSVLDAAKKYTVVFRKSIDRKPYFSEMGEEETAEFSFRPLEKSEDIKIYHVADVHYLYSVAEKVASYFGEDTDLFIVNGDIGEVDTEENLFETSAFVGKISGGNVPVIFVRGNHDVRGRAAEKYHEFFPANGTNTYFEFGVGCIGGIVMDCGEDKPDSSEEYGGTNAFEKYRRRELEWLRSASVPDRKYRLAICHVCFVRTTKTAGGKFDIERELYTEYNREVERMNIDFMVSAHVHDAFILEQGDPRNLIDHTYPVVVGSKLVKMDYQNLTIDRLYGTAIVLNPGRAEIAFTDQNHEILSDLTYTLTFPER